MQFDAQSEYFLVNVAKSYGRACSRGHLTFEMFLKQLIGSFPKRNFFKCNAEITSAAVFNKFDRASTFKALSYRIVTLTFREN